MTEKDNNRMWEYLYGYAPKDRPSQVTFFDRSNGRLFRDVELSTLGAHGWELISVLPGESESGERRYEYWLKRDKRDRPKSVMSDVE